MSAADVWALYSAYMAVERAYMSDAGRALRPTLIELEAQICAAIERQGGVAKLDKVTLRVEHCHIDGKERGTWFVVFGEHTSFRPADMVRDNVAANSTLARLSSPELWKRGVLLEAPVNSASR